MIPENMLRQSVLQRKLNKYKDKQSKQSDSKSILPNLSNDYSRVFSEYRSSTQIKPTKKQQPYDIIETFPGANYAQKGKFVDTRRPEHIERLLGETRN